MLAVVREVPDEYTRNLISKKKIWQTQSKIRSKHHLSAARSLWQTQSKILSKHHLSGARSLWQTQLQILRSEVRGDGRTTGFQNRGREISYPIYLKVAVPGKRKNYCSATVCWPTPVGVQIFKTGWPLRPLGAVSFFELLGARQGCGVRRDRCIKIDRWC